MQFISCSSTAKNRTIQQTTMFRFLVICGCLLAVAQAGVIGGGFLTAGPALAVQSVQPGLAIPTAVGVPAISTSNIIRGIGNLGAVSASSKSIDTPFSSVRDADVRIDNPGIVAPAFAYANTAVAAPVATAAIAPGLGLGLGAVRVLG